jgi:hypothetical protein
MAVTSGLGGVGDNQQFYDPFLMYVPPRKSQAKGIETGALDRDGMVTLGDHSAVSADVQQLSSRYATLWRLIVLVHPSHASDCVALSHAVDVLLLEMFPTLDLHDYAAIGEIARCAWFDYIPLEKRSTAKRYGELTRRNGKRALWRNFERVNRTCTDAVSGDEYVLRALLLDRLSKEPENVDDNTQLILRRFPAADGVTIAVARAREKFALEGAQGATEDDHILWAISELAEQIGGKAQPELFTV